MNKKLFYTYKILGLIACITALLGVMFINELLQNISYTTFIMLEIFLMSISLFCLTKFKCSNYKK